MLRPSLLVLTVTIGGCTFVTEADLSRLDGEPIADGDADSDADADTHVDADTDLDADSDADADADADGDADPPPAEAIGHVTGSFETRWGTLDDEDPLGTGSGSLDATVGGDALEVTAVGAAAGPHPDDQLLAALDAVAVLDDGMVVVAWFVLSPRLVGPGAEIPLERGGRDAAALLHLDPTTGEWTAIGVLDGGSLFLEEAGTSEGATIRAHFEGDLVDVPWL